MQGKRNKQLMILLVVLVTTILALVYMQQTEEVRFEQRDIFKVEDLKSIDRVELFDGKDTIQLSFSGNRWMVNSSEVADRDMIDVLFATLLQAEAKRPVTASKNDSLVEEIKKNGVRVTLFEQENVVKSFVAGGNNKKSEAYFVNDADQAYVMHIPGYRVYVSGVFEQTESDWRDKYVFAFNWTNFKKLSVDFQTDDKGDFVVRMLDGYFGIEGIPADTTQLNDFLDAVSLLTVDQYVQNDSLLEMQPVMTIEVNDLADRSYKLSIFNWSVSGKTACLINEKQAAWVDNRKLARLARKCDFFLKKAELP